MVSGMSENEDGDEEGDEEEFKITRSLAMEQYHQLFRR
jgi:hypothetical protein